MGKKLFSLLLTAALLLSSGVTACAASASSGEVLITLSDSGVKVDGTPASADPADAVYTGADIIYYADGTDCKRAQFSQKTRFLCQRCDGCKKMHK